MHGYKSVLSCLHRPSPFSCQWISSEVISKRCQILKGPPWPGIVTSCPLCQWRCLSTSQYMSTLARIVNLGFAAVVQIWAGDGGDKWTEIISNVGNSPYRRPPAELEPKWKRLEHTWISRVAGLHGGLLIVDGKLFLMIHVTPRKRAREAYTQRQICRMTSNDSLSVFDKESESYQQISSPKQAVVNCRGTMNRQLQNWRKSHRGSSLTGRLGLYPRTVIGGKVAALLTRDSCCAAATALVMETRVCPLVDRDL